MPSLYSQIGPWTARADVTISCLDALPNVARVQLMQVIDLMVSIGNDPFLSENARNAAEKEWTSYFWSDRPNDVGFEHVAFRRRRERYLWSREQQAGKALFAALASSETATSVGEHPEGVRVRIDPILYDGPWMIGWAPNEIIYDTMVDVPDDSDPLAKAWWESFANEYAGKKYFYHVRVDRAWLAKFIESAITPSKSSIAAEKRAIEAAAEILKTTPNISSPKLSDLLRARGHDFSKIGFKKRIWPEGRDSAGLPKKGTAGAKPRGNRAG
jgi:hypothetical protein